MILFGLRDVGSVNVCLPVVTILKDRRIPVSVYAEGSAYERFKDKFSFIPECKIDDLLDFVKPSLVVATCAVVGGAIPIEMTRKAKQRDLPVVLIEEMWAGHSAFIWDVLPDGVCVMDRFSKDLILKSWPDYLESRIHVTGTPIFDKFINVQVRAAKHKMREALGLDENWPVVFFPGTGLVSGMADAVGMLVEALNSLNIPVYLILRDHPSVSFSRASEYRDMLRNLKIGQIVDSSEFTSDEVNAGSDIVIGTFSTMTVGACYMRKPVLIIWTSEVGRTLVEATNGALTVWPIITLGAALKAESVEEIKIGLLNIIAGDTENMRSAQEAHCKTDGLSGERVAEAILSYYRS